MIILTLTCKIVFFSLTLGLNNKTKAILTFLYLVFGISANTQSLRKSLLIKIIKQSY